MSDRTNAEPARSRPKIQLPEEAERSLRLAMSAAPNKVERLAANATGRPIIRVDPLCRRLQRINEVIRPHYRRLEQLQGHRVLEALFHLRDQLVHRLRDAGEVVRRDPLIQPVYTTAGSLVSRSLERNCRAMYHVCYHWRGRTKNSCVWEENLLVRTKWSWRTNYSCSPYQRLQPFRHVVERRVFLHLFVDEIVMELADQICGLSPHCVQVLIERENTHDS